MNSKTPVPHPECSTGSKIRFGVLIKGLLRKGLPIGSWRRSDVNCKLLCANVAPWLAFCYYGHEVSCSCWESFQAETTAHRSAAHHFDIQGVVRFCFFLLLSDFRVGRKGSVWCKPVIDRVTLAKTNTKTCMFSFSLSINVIVVRMLQGRRKHCCWGIMLEKEDQTGSNSLELEKTNCHSIFSNVILEECSLLSQGHRSQRLLLPGLQLLLSQSSYFQQASESRTKN